MNNLFLFWKQIGRHSRTFGTAVPPRINLAMSMVTEGDIALDQKGVDDDKLSFNRYHSHRYGTRFVECIVATTIR